MGPGGYLSERGLIPLPDEKFRQVQEAVVKAAPMESPSS
jgi:phosphate transport system substrate-binding protein